jgi:hypothetical protein
MILERNAELERLCVFTHGALCVLHLLGVVYNIRRKNYFDVTAHSVAFVYDLYAATNHMKGIHAPNLGI